MDICVSGTSESHFVTCHFMLQAQETKVQEEENRKKIHTYNIIILRVQVS